MRTRQLLLIAMVGLGACTAADTEPYPTTPALETLPPVVATSPTGLRTTISPGAMPALPPTTSLELQVVETISGDISPRSVVATGTGLFFAQNTTSHHTVTVYDQNHELIATIPDTVEIAETELSGAPAEAVPTSDGAYVYVSNYRMSGPGYSRPGSNECDLADWNESFVYRIDAVTLEIDQVISVGAVPTFLAVTPDDATVLVSNRCSFDMSVIDTSTGTEAARVELGRHPQGIAVADGGLTAYVAIAGSTNVAVVDLESRDVEWMRGVGANPGHLVLDPTDRFLYATLQGEGRVIRIDLSTGEVVGRARTGSAPGGISISDDGLSLYVTDYNSHVVSKINAETMEILQTLSVPEGPIGITFDSANRQVWVASDSGTITVLTETDETR